MPNGMNYEMDFEKHMRDMPDRQLLEFMARQIFEVCGKVQLNETRLIALEGQNRKWAGIAGGIAGALAGIILGAINWLINRS